MRLGVTSPRASNAIAPLGWVCQDLLLRRAPVLRSILMLLVMLLALFVSFSRGALSPNEVWPYQWLPLLPLVLLLVVRGIERRQVGVLLLLGIFLLGFYRQPCDLIFPNLWTLAAIGVFVLGVWQNRLFRKGLDVEERHGAQQ